MIADEAGIVSAHGPAFTLGDQFRRAACCRIDTLIINGLEREPLLQVRQCLLEHATVDIIEAAEWLCRAIGLQECRLAVGRKDRRLASHCQASSRGKSVRLVRLASKYPQAAPVLLARTITGRETPCGRTPDHVGVLVVELEPLVALAVAVRENRPMTEVLVTVTGPAVLKHGNYRVPIGMPFVEVLQSVGLSSTPARLVDGGPMTGRAVVDSDAVVTKLTSAILVFDHIHDHVPTPGACIRCGWCQDECPVGLDPLALLDAFERHDLARARGLHVDACLECGLCSALCPSRLPLSEAGTHLKKSVIY